MLVFTNKHGENLLDDALDNNGLSYATEVDTDEIPGVNSDLSEMNDVPDEEILSPDAGIEQSSQENNESGKNSDCPRER